MNSDRINSLLRSKEILQARLKEIDIELNDLGYKGEYKAAPIDETIISVLTGIMNMEAIIAAVNLVRPYHEQYIRASMSELVGVGVVHKIGTKGRGVKYCLQSKWEMLQGVVND